MLTIVIKMTIINIMKMTTKKRCLFLLVSVTTLIIGGVLYLFFRKESYIGQLLPTLTVALPVGPWSEFILYWVPDYLWGVSLAAALFAVLLPSGIWTWCWCGVVACYGAVWEGLQLWKIVSGTADWWDVLSYIAAALTVVIINFSMCKERKT